VLFAKKREVLKNLSEQFAERKVKKFYKAFTEQAPARLQGRLENWHRKEKKKAALYDHEIEYSEKAILDYSVDQLSERRFRWNIELQTGKYHQIRAQLASTGCPIIGDELYGSTTAYRTNAIALEAYRLVFQHPVTGETLDVNVPKDLSL
jgi:23S rRNA-/tRNA-specific pseudouridylate synthase